MKRMQLAFGLVVALVMSSSLALAQTPNFAGKWTVIPDPAATGPGMGGVGQSAVIKQDASSLTVTRSTQMGEFTSVYKLDGTESKNTLNFQGNAIDQISKTKWDGSTLKIDTTMNFDGNPVQIAMAMSLDPSGNLVVVTTRPDFQGGGAPVTTTTKYKKGE